MIRAILFFSGCVLIIFLFTEEFARVRHWLRATLDRHPRRRLILYPLILALLAAAGIVIAFSLINFATGFTFSYE